MDRKEIKKVVGQAILAKYGDNKMNENEQTEHGQNIVSQIDCDFLGHAEYLTIADIHCILDAIHSHFMDTGRDNKFLLVWMEELLNKYPELEVW